MELPKKLKKEIDDYCKLNDIKDVQEFVSKVLKDGFDIERYGLLDNNQPKIIEKEIEKIVYRDIIKEVPVIEYVEKPIEVIKEVEKIVTIEKKLKGKNKETIKEVLVEDKEKQKKLEATIQKLREELKQKINTIQSLEDTIKDFKTNNNKSAVYLNGSNLNNLIK